MLISRSPILIHTAIQAGIGALATRFYNGQSHLGKLFFEEPSTPIRPLMGALFGASSALFFHISSKIFTRVEHDEEAQDRGRRALNKAKKYAFVIYTGILAASIYTSFRGSPFSFKTSLIFSAAMIGTVVEIILASVVAASPILIGVGCFYGLRWIRR